MLTLSKFIPVRMTSEYTSITSGRRERASWIQWRERIFAHRVAAI